jgi:hypothetical protein
VPVGDAGGDGAGGGRSAGGQAADADLQALGVAPPSSRLPLSSFGLVSSRPLVCRLAPPAAGRPLGAGEGEPQGGGAPGAAPDARAAVDGPHAAAEGAWCGCGRLLGRRRRRR